MATKKNNPKKSAGKKTIIVKIAGQVGYLAGELSAGKDRLVEMTGDAIESVKSTIQNIATKKSAAKKAGKAKAKKTITKNAIPGARSTTTPAAKKTTPPKKSIKKTTKSASVKKK